jgi:voltage-gated potassium channel
MTRKQPRGSRWSWRRETKTLFWVVAAIVLVVVVGTAGYMLLFGWSFMDALYQTVTTITTVGFHEVRELSTGGRVFTILLILSGVGVILYGLATIVEYAIKAQLSGVFKRRAVRKQVDKLENHYIICGYGRVGESVARHFATQDASFVITSPRRTRRL